MASEEAVNALVSRIVSQIQGSTLHMQLQKAAHNEVTKSSLRLSDLRRGIIGELTKAGWEKRLRNSVYQCMQKFPPPPHPLAPAEHVKEPISYIRKAQVTWEKRILKSLNSMCTELSVPLARKRAEKEQKELLSRWQELGADEPDLSQFRPVYAPKDFLEVIAALRNNNLVDCGEPGVATTMWGIVQVSLPIRDLHELRVQFSEMSINQCQTGVDDCPEIPVELYENDRTKFTKKVLSHNHSPVAQEFAKKGCPMGFRGRLWCSILNINVDDVLSLANPLKPGVKLRRKMKLELRRQALLQLHDILYYEQLKASVLQHDLLVDNLIYKDVKLTTTNDDQYFVFEDYIYQILLPFSRDTVVLKHFATTSCTPAKSYIRGKLGLEQFSVCYPPNGVIPFHGFSMYVAPLCFIYDDPVMLYYVFREMYVRYFSKLHSLSSDSQGIISLCLLFENLLQTQEPQLFYHLKVVGIQPLRIAFKWLIRAFSGYLASEQVLLLWDRVLAYNSLEVLAVLAMAIFSFRKTNLLQVQTFSAAEGVLADISTLKVIPLIQLSLFAE